MTKIFSLFHIFCLFNFIVVIANIAKAEQQPKSNNTQVQSKTSTTITCNKLTAMENGAINCYLSNTFQNNCTTAQEPGTIAKYNCNPYYVLNQEAFLEHFSPIHGSGGGASEEEQSLKCDGNGNWAGATKFNLLNCVEDCGIRVTNNPKPLIVNGVSANSTSWPWHATLFRETRPNIIEYICGGSIISSSAVLTAAHCVTNLAGRLLDPNNTMVVVGAVSSIYSENVGRNGVQIFQIQQIFIPESYDVRKDYQSDLAILHLDKRINFNEVASPVCLPFLEDYVTGSDTVNVGKQAKVVGFGVTEAGFVSQTLREGALEIKSHSDCFVKMNHVLTESQICAGRQRGHKLTTVCNGDSGGGLVLSSVVHEKIYITGVVSSGEPLSSSSRVCESYAVFTRVASFIPWIRRILTEISGATSLLDIEAGRMAPYSQKGTETRRQLFIPIPKVYKNHRLSSIELAYVDIVPDVLQKLLLEHKSIRSINLTQVKLKNEFTRIKVHLPALTTVKLDILRDDFVLDESRAFPSPDIQHLISSLIFFEKVFDEGDFYVPNALVQPQLNIDITVHIFELIKIDYVKGMVSFSQLPFTNEILRNLLLPSSNFHLRHLALSSCLLDVNIIKGQTHLKSLTLDHVKINDFLEFTQFLRSLRGLKEFAYVPDSSQSEVAQTFSLNDLPKSLKHLSLTYATVFAPLVVNPLRASTPLKHESSITFPRSKRSTNAEDPNIKFPEIDIFYCNSCNLSSAFIKNLNRTFPKLNQLVIESNNFVEQIANKLPAFRHLKQAFLFTNLSGSKEYIKLDGSWGGKYLSEVSYRIYKDNFNFELNKFSNFWTSQAEYIAKHRLSQAELNAFDSGHYKFKPYPPPATPSPDGATKIQITSNLAVENKFPLIPRYIQEKLEIIDIINADFSWKILESSLAFVKGLKRLRLINVSSTDPLFKEPVVLPNLVELILTRQSSYDYPIFDYKLFSLYIHSIFEQMFVFREEGLNLRTSLLTSLLLVAKIHLQYGNCVGVSWNAREGLVVSVVSFTNDWFKNFKPARPSTVIRMFAYKYKRLDPQYVPDTITHLNLNFVVLKEPEQLLSRLPLLKDLRFINVRLHDDDEFTNWEWASLDFSKFNHTAMQSLANLALQKAQISIYSAIATGVKFPSLKVAYFEDCIFESNFGGEFSSIFPNLKKLVLLSGKETPDSSQLAIQQLMLLNALKSSSLTWILSAGSYFKSLEGNSIEGEIENILNESGVNNTFSSNDEKGYFIIKRVNNMQPWTLSNDTYESIESLLFRMKGTTAFGTSWQCHGYLYADVVRSHELKLGGRH